MEPPHAGRTGEPLALAVLLTIVFPLLDLVRYDAGILAGLLVDLTLVPGPLHLSFELVATGTQFSDCLLGQKFLQSPFFDILLLVFFQLCNELNSALENGALVLFTARDYLCELVDTFVDRFATAAFH